MTVVYLISPVETNNGFVEERRASLSEQGKKRTEEVIKFFEEKEVAAIYSSPYPSAIDTVRSLAKQLHKSIYVVEEFKERVVGNITESYERFEEKQWKDFHYKSQDGESLLQLQNRVIDGIAMLVNQEKNRIVVVSTHTNAMCMAMQFFDECYSYQEYLQTKQRKPAIAKFTFDGEICLDIEEVMYL